MAVHSKIGASSMYRWKECPGSVRLSVGIESVSSTYAQEGTFAHEVLADILLGKQPKDAVEPEMLEAVMVGVEHVRKVSAPGSKVLIEHQFDLSKVHPGLFGTADAVVYIPATKTLHVIDYKHGAGIPVEVKDNPQLLYYALGALFSLKLPIAEVISTIVQPRCYHKDGPVRSHSYDAVQVMDFAADLVIFARATEAPEAALSPGDHCRFCPAVAVCPKIHEKALQAAKNEFRQDVSYDPKKLSETLTLLDAIEAWAKGVRAFAYAEAQHGRCPPGWKLVSKRATRKWTDPKKVTTFLELEFRDVVLRQCFTEPEIKSVAQLEKVIGKEHWPKLIPFVVSESSGPTLAPEHDPRPAIKADAVTEFKVLE